jgi:NAD dependent epimerase/dehydratase family enzyme
MGLPYTKLTEDYALVARFMNPSTERMTVIAAGIGQYGTIAAGEFLTNEKYMREFAATAPANWERRNFAVVIATRVIDGSTGPPRVLATWFW